jgi:hypothetical protein
MPGMDEKLRKPPPAMKGTVVAPVAVLVLAPLLYVLSIGPAYALLLRGHITEQSIEVAYFPIVAVANRSASAREWLIWYWGLWVPLGP